MSIYTWIGIGIYAFFTLLPLKDAKNIGKWKITSIIINTKPFSAKKYRSLPI
ncbi:hypothetical protein MKX96_18535 [Psychrobacillus sp. FSL W7-1493]|uniref:hypothetical protein n=1 Tax=Psychrobacillus sp. FSL W7-1493 TaxID=2921552 RepID=UPI0030F750BB